MSLDSIEELRIEQVQDVYCAEKQLVKALPKMAKVTGGQVAAALVLLLAAAVAPLSAQSTSRLTVTPPQDTSCVNDARPLGDSSRTSQPQVWTDSAGMNKPNGGRRICGQHEMGVGPDGSCMMGAGDSTMHLQGDRGASASKKADSLGSVAREGRMRSDCVKPMGAGVGMDSTQWHQRTDSMIPRKP